MNTSKGVLDEEALKFLVGTNLSDESEECR